MGKHAGLCGWMQNQSIKQMVGDCDKMKTFALLRDFVEGRESLCSLLVANLMIVPPHLNPSVM